MKRFEGQTVAITGAGQGLGLAMAERLASEGAAVHIAELQPGAGADAAARLSAKHGVPCRGDEVDVTDAAQTRAWIDGIVHDRGQLHALINNAGLIRDGRVENLSDEDWARVIDVNLTGVFNGTRAALPHMKAAGYGRLVSFSSMSWRGNFGQANYVAAKAGVVGFARGVALESAKYGVTSNVIAPGLIDTPMLASMDDRGRALLTGKVPLGRIGDPADIAAGAAFLCAPEAGYVTGVVLDVDGGISIGSTLR